MLSDVDTGAFVEPSKVTLREFLERWLRDYVAAHVPKASTREASARKVNNPLIPKLGTIHLSQLTAVKLQEFYRTKLDSGLSSTTVYTLFATAN